MQLKRVWALARGPSKLVPSLRFQVARLRGHSKSLNLQMIRTAIQVTRVAKGKGKGRGLEPAAVAPAASTWAERLGAATQSGRVVTVKGAKGQGKTGDATRRDDSAPSPVDQPAPRDASLSLLHKAYGTDAILQVADLRASLEVGKIPAKGSVVLCTDSAFEDLSRLAKLQGLQHAAIALLLPRTMQKEEKPPQGAKAFLLPTWERGAASLRWFWVRPLGSSLPSLPSQAPAKTDVAVSDDPLVTFRATLVCDLCTKDRWEACRRNPAGLIYQVFGGKTVHATYGWKDECCTKEGSC